MAKSPQSYQAMQAELDLIITEFQSSALDVDEAADKFKRATELIDKLESYLTQTENKIKKLTTRKNDT